MPLQAMPSAVPHMELPLYQKENAGMAKKPEMTKNTSAGLAKAAPASSNALPSPPPIAASTGNTTNSSKIPAVICLMAMPMR